MTVRTGQAGWDMTELVAVRPEESAGSSHEALSRVPSRITRRRTAHRVSRTVIDVLALALAGALALRPGEWGVGSGVAVLLLSLVGFAAVGSYTSRLRPRFDTELVPMVAAIGFAVLTVAAANLLITGRSGVGDSAVRCWLLASLLAVAGRVGVSAAWRALGHRQATARTLIVGAGHVGHLVARRLLASPGAGLVPVGFLDNDPLRPHEDVRLQTMPDVPILGATGDLERVVREERVEQVVVAFSTSPHDVMLGIVRRCWQLGVDVLVVPRLYEVEGRRTHVERLGALPLVGLRTSNPRGWQFTVKYALDRLVAGIALLTAAPLLAAVALAILVTTGRPLLFRQQRVGRDGHVFEMLKFRTMQGAPGVDGEADAVWAEHMVSAAYARQAPLMSLSAVADSDADRRTPLGTLLRKLSIDELPQLWNVVRGDMSLIGPRPERVHYVERFETAVYRYPERHRVKSGLTGWAQVNGLRGETSLASRIEWDNYYIENWTPWLDLKILAMTFPTVLGRRGAS